MRLRRSWLRTVVAVLSAVLLEPATRPVEPGPKLVLHTVDRPEVVLLHLPGISGFRSIDRTLVRGMVDALGEGRVVARAYDWPAYDYGMGALMAYRRNLVEAEFAAGWIAEVAGEYPGVPIVLTSHSGGAGIAAWALERLPAGVEVSQWVLLAPALSPEFDLSGALRRVSGRAWSLTSATDPVLKMTRAFGTIDRKMVPSAGLSGFVRPAGADVAAYGRLVEVPYEDDWARFGHLGDHVGMMERAFAREVLGPRVLGAMKNAAEFGGKPK